MILLTRKIPSQGNFLNHWFITYMNSTDGYMKIGAVEVKWGRTSGNHHGWWQKDPEQDRILRLDRSAK